MIKTIYLMLIDYSKPIVQIRTSIVLRYKIVLET